MLCRTMHGIMYFFVIVILIGKPLDVYSDEVACISNYQELKESLLRRKCNVDALVSVFYPIGELRPSSVDVSYYQLPRNVDIGRNDSCNAWDQVIQEKDLAATKFRWLNSPTLLVADLHVLEHMSFMRLAVVEDRIDYIIVDPFCEKITDSEQIKILSLLTTFVSVHALKESEGNTGRREKEREGGIRKGGGEIMAGEGERVMGAREGGGKKKEKRGEGERVQEISISYRKYIYHTASFICNRYTGGQRPQIILYTH